MTLTMYERIGHEGRRPSPFSWRIRYALAHKGVEPQFCHVRFADVETIRALSGQHFVPIITAGDRVIHDSWNIACYLQERFPDRPSLFDGGAERAVTRLVNHFSASIPRTAPITDARARPPSAARSKNIAPTGRAGLPNSARSPHRLKRHWQSSLTSQAMRPAMRITSFSRSFSMPGSAAPPSSSARAPRCVAGATGWCKPSTASATATRATRRNFNPEHRTLGHDPVLSSFCS
jgi:hypothetical protein